MTNFRKDLRNGIAIVICLAATTMISACDTWEDPIDTPATSAVELTSPITANRTLKDLGLPIDYVFKGNYHLRVENNAILSIEDSVTIQFTNAGGGIEIANGATIKALGTADKPIQFVGGAQKGSWDGLYIQTDKENQLTYVDMINGGSRTDFQNCPAVITLENGGKLAMTYSKISGSKCNGLSAGFQGATITAFTHNVIENCDLTPVYLYPNEFRLATVFDVTSEMSNNTLAYISLPNISLPQNASITINKTSVPYYVRDYGGELQSKLTINEGVTFYMAETASIVADYAAGTGQLVINGTAENPVLFTRLPGTNLYWRYIVFGHNRNHSLKNCIFEYGGKEENNGALTFEREATVALQNVTIRNSLNYGATLFAVSPVTHNNTTVFENCRLGNVGLYFAHVGIVETILTQLP